MRRMKNNDMNVILLVNIICKTDLYNQIQPYNQLHLDLRVDFVVEVVVGNFVDIPRRAIADCVHKWHDVWISRLEYEVWEVIEDGQADDVERDPLVL